MYTDKFARSATAQLQPPVCIGDIPAEGFSVSANEKTGFVSKVLRNNPKLPGVLLYDGNDFVGMIPRQIIFERLGRLYGVDLFLNKEISVLYKELRISEPLVLLGEMRVDQAVRKALARDEDNVYHPIVVFYKGTYQLLDMHRLITVQSSMLENLNTVATKLNQCKTVIQRGKEDLGIEKVIDALREVVPFHDAGIYTYHELERTFYLKGEAFIHTMKKTQNSASFNRLPESFKQIICMDDVHGIPLWKGMAHLTEHHPKAWMGVPLVSSNQYLGTLSLSRFVHTPFLKNETELTGSYAWYLSMLISKVLTGSFPDDMQVTLSKKARLHSNQFFFAT